MNGLRNRLAFAADGARLAFSNGVGAVVSFVYLVMVARLVNEARFADLALCVSIVYIGNLFLGPVNLTLIRFSARYQATEDEGRIRPLLGRSFRLYAPWVAGTFLVAVILAVPIARAFRLKPAILVPMTVVLIALSLSVGALRAIALGTHKNRVYSRSILIETLVRVSVGLSLVIAFRTAGAGLAGFAVGYLTAILLLVALVRQLPPAADRDWTDGPDVSRFMTAALALSAVVAGLQNIDIVVAKVALGSQEVGEYAVASTLARGFLLIASPFGAAALATAPVGVEGGERKRWLPSTPVAAYLAVSALFLVVLVIAPRLSIELVFGLVAQSYGQLVPTLALACTLAGAFLILALKQLRLGQFAFLVPVAGVLTAEVAALTLTSPSAISFARIVLAANIAAIVMVQVTPTMLRLFRPFKGSADYWDARYARRGTSGGGSQGKFANFKAEVLNQFVSAQGINSVAELGCGDGRQLALAKYPQYTGYDVSPKAIRLCRGRFEGDATKRFFTVAQYSGERADLSLSLDVIYHLVEDNVYEEYMQLLFRMSKRWVIIYSSDTDDNGDEAPHVRHRAFTRWVMANEPSWVLRQRIPNRFPYDGDPRLGSFSDFFIFERQRDDDISGKRRD